MNDSLLLSVAVFVFFMAVIGFALTVREFNHGRPKQEEHAAEKNLRNAA